MTLNLTNLNYKVTQSVSTPRKHACGVTAFWGLTALLSLAACSHNPPASPAAPASTDPVAAKGLFNQPVNIAWTLSDTFAKYDHNRNGRIELNLPDNFFKRLVTSDERLRKEAVKSYENDPSRNTRQCVYTVYTYSLRDAFYASDSNKDGTVTQAEFLALLKRFDTDHNGELTRRGLWGWLTGKPKGEYDGFNTAYGERLISTTRFTFDDNDPQAVAQVEQGANVVRVPTQLDPVATAAPLPSAQGL